MRINEILTVFNEALEQEFRVPFFAGFYESLFVPDCQEGDLFNEPYKVPDEILEFCMNNAEQTDFEDYKKEVCEGYIENLNTAMQKEIPNFHAEYADLEQPASYNYEGDALYAKVDYSLIKDAIKKYLDEHKDAFKDWVKKHHSSYDRFISFYSNNADEWNIDEVDHNELGSIIGFILEDAQLIDKDYDLNSLTYEDVFAHFTVDLEEVKNNFKFDVEPQSLEDLEHYNKEPVDGVYILNKEADGQQKLDLGV